ncbi:MAG TPA: elongation factor G [Lentisphaeria bacterium]|nr:MAG: translation elongation factor G [Lentisphaerae bacterium GWF2_38_69]HBM16592.1 elongation factor G [Lentisphaeria bacterium]
MQNESVNLSNIRNIGIIAHIDAGKTTLSERFLYYSGKTYKIGDIDTGTTVMDYLDEERARGITIAAAAASFNWNDKLYHLIDTPGHIDFTAEVERSLRVIDGAIVVFSAVEGVEAQSEKVWRQSDKYKVAKLAFINKLDRLGASFERVVKDIQSKFNETKSIPVQMPIGSESSFNCIIDLISMKLLDFQGDDGSKVIASEIPALLKDEAEAMRLDLIASLADLSDEIADYFLEEKPVNEELLKKVIRELVIDLKLCPIFCGSAKRNMGIQPVLDAIGLYLPSPEDFPIIKALSTKTNEQVEISIHDSNFSALVFKVIASNSGDLLYIRTYSGNLSSDTMILNPRTMEKLKVKRILRLYAKNIEPVDNVGPGDIVGLVGLKDTTTGDTLCAINKAVSLERVVFPEPVISMAIEPRSLKDKDKLSYSLEMLCREDPTLSTTKDESTGQAIISGMGELHLEINTNRLKNEFNLDIRHGAPKVVYKETLLKESSFSGLFNKVIADNEFYAEVSFRLEPVPRLQAGLEVKAEIKNMKTLPHSWINAALEALKNGLKTGGNWGYSLTYIRGTITGITGIKDKTNEGSITGAVLNGINAAIRSGTIILEPITKVEILSPENTIGDITTYLQSKRAIIYNVQSLQNIKKLDCEVPLAEMFGFSKALPKLSGGRASFSMEPCGYQELSKENMNRIQNAF